MDRQQRFEALTTIPEADAIRLADRVRASSPGPFAVITPPTVGMIMARAIDGALGEQFNLGEVLVTEARVTVAGHEGWGMVLGGRPEHALAVATVDAALEAGHAAHEQIVAELARLVARAENDAHAEWARVAPTRVQFDSL
jgi:alpha-D-ribose 1-methylphosphonate 5-triphosphate synthase subunit PhnG